MLHQVGVDRSVFRQRQTFLQTDYLQQPAISRRCWMTQSQFYRPALTPQPALCFWAIL